MLSSAFETARPGMAAKNIANASSQDHVPQRVAQSGVANGASVRTEVRPVTNNSASAENGVDLAREATTLTQARAVYAANIAVIEAVDEMTQSLFDMVDDSRREREERYILPPQYFLGLIR